MCRTLIVDVNECKCGAYPCGANTACINKDGSYECQCKDGFEGDPSTECTGTLQCCIECFI